jgi:glycogen debranching enzyme
VSRDGAYHQGTAWPWLLGPFAEAHFKVYGEKRKALALLEPLREQLTAFGVGSLAEVYDGSEPQRPNGCFAQAWSVAETLRVWQSLVAS